MARRFLEETLPYFFTKKDISRKVETPQQYLEVARKCTERVKNMTSASASTAFNHWQCAHLAYKVEMAFQYVDTIYEYGYGASIVGVMKRLCQCAEEAEAFIQSCHQDKWVQAAVLLWNSYEYVSSLCSDLDVCRIIPLEEVFEKLPVEVASPSDIMTTLKVLYEDSDSRDAMARTDQMALLWRLKAMDESTYSSDEEHELVKYLSGILTQHLTGVVESKVWEINLSILRQVERLGSGSVGMVRKSTWLGVEVAEKMFYGTDPPSFRNEVDILAGLSHPNIVPLLGYAMDEDRCSIVMELMDGDLLFLMEERLRQNPWSGCPFTASEGVDMMLQSAEGMRYLHDKKVVHKGLKSQNILVKRRKSIDSVGYILAKVADFGLSKTKEHSSSYSNLTLNTGTTRWMAPELLWQGDQDPQARTAEVSVQS